ncbi:MAG TPA: glutathione S-transferase family protein [Steroidobacteraceae bacterium]
MYQLYIANKNYSSWSLRPWVLMRVLNISFEERLVKFEATGNYERFRKFSPTGKVPCLVDGSTTVWDSLAIAEYLAEQHPNVWPRDRAARAWARSATAEMHSGFATLRERCTMNCGIRVRLHEMPDALEQDIARIGELWNDGLTRFGGPFLAGKEFTAVDAFFAPVAFRIQTYGLELDEQASAYAARLRDLPAMQEWYRDALAETYRDEPHEEDARRLGTWLEDFRAKA